MTGWADLTRELDEWVAAGRVAEFWWRDDDAVTPTAELDRLIGLHRTHRVPLSLAVIPARATPALAARLSGEPGIAVFQHGWAHINHSGPGRAKAELGPDRTAAYVLGELARGSFVLDSLFGRSWLKVLVPPHNRIAPGIAAGLEAAGYVGLSADRPRERSNSSLTRVNTHVDIMDWTTRSFLGDGPSLDRAIAHLCDRRLGRVDPDEPTGLLTHHLAHDDAAWAFLDTLLGRLSGHKAARWCDPRTLFARAATAGVAA